jgi:hypothetical protein
MPESNDLLGHLGDLLESEKSQRQNLNRTLQAVEKLRSDLARRNAKQLWSLLEEWASEFRRGRVKTLYDEIQAELCSLEENASDYMRELSTENNSWNIPVTGDGAFYVRLLDLALRPGNDMSKPLAYIFERQAKVGDNPFLDTEGR